MHIDCLNGRGYHIFTTMGGWSQARVQQGLYVSFGEVGAMTSDLTWMGKQGVAENCYRAVLRAQLWVLANSWGSVL